MDKFFKVVGDILEENIALAFYIFIALMIVVVFAVSGGW